MKERKQLPKTIKIGDCELDVPSGIVVDGDRSTKLVPKSVDVLIHLAKHADQLVTHDQLMASVWPDQFVTEVQISKHIGRIREALGDNQTPNRYIETLPKRGYRLICKCEIVEDSAASNEIINTTTSLMTGEIDQAHPPQTLQQRQWMPSLTAAGIAVLVIALGYFVYESRFAEETLVDDLQIAGVVTDKSVAVLPFVDLSPNRDQEWYSDGLTEEIINSLAQLPELRVSARTSSFRFRGENLVIPEIAAQLGVAYMVEGSVQRDGDRLRITAQLIRAEDGFHLWSESYDGSTEAIFDVQEDVAESIAMALDVFLDDERRELMFKLGTRNAGAYEAYLQGWDIWNNYHGGRGPRDLNLWDANVFFDRSMALDPDFASAALMHSDAFIHVMISGNSHIMVTGDNNPMHSVEAARTLALADMDRAAANARDPTQRLGIELQRAYFSMDWNRIPGLIARLREQFDSYPWRHTDDGYFPSILGILGEYEMFRVLAEARLAEDPLDPRGLIYMVSVEKLTGNFDAARGALARRRDVRGQTEGRDEVYIAHTEGNREEVIRRLEKLVETPLSNGATAVLFAYLAAVKGDYAEATRLMNEYIETNPFTESRAYWLMVLHETGDKERSRELTQKLDALQGGTNNLTGWLIRFGNLRLFDPADAPNLAAQLRQAGIDLDSFKELPRLSAMAQASQ